MATAQTTIAAGSSSSVALAGDTTRRYLYIKNYVNGPNGGSSQTGSIYVAFGKDATLGTAGEIEILPGEYYIFGGPLPPRVGNLPHGFVLPVCPTEDIRVISNVATTYGAIMTQ